MFSLVIALISIALVAALAAATVYFGGEAMARGDAAARAAKILVQGQQVLGAAELFYADNHRWPSSLEELVANNYLRAIPAVPVQTALGEVTAPAYAGSASALWVMPKAGRPTFVLSSAVNVPACREVNQKSRGDNGILKHPYINLAAQCFGSVDNELTVVITKEPDKLAADLTPTAVQQAAVPTDLASIEWHHAPSQALASVGGQVGGGSGSGTSEGGTQAPAQDPVLQWQAGSLPVAAVGGVYSASLGQFLQVDGSPYGGTGATWSVVSGALPDGLFLTSDGFISGTPTAEGSGSVQIRATYGASSIEKTFEVSVQAIDFGFSTMALPGAMVSKPYLFDLKSALYSNEVTLEGELASFSVSGLPSWMSASSAGVLSGTPSVANEAGAAISVTANYRGLSKQQSFTIYVNGVALRVKQISVGDWHTCAVTESGGAKCWGYNTYGQMGNGSNTSTHIPSDVVGLTSGVKQVVAGLKASCAVTTAGAVYCWGQNNHGILGNGAGATSNVPLTVSGVDQGVVSMSLGSSHACAILSTGAMKCWGNNTYGQLGNGTTTTSSVPVDVLNLSEGAVKVSAGESHTCAVTSAGAAKCWGYGSLGELGTSPSGDKYRPTQVVGLTSGVTDIAAGYSFSCAAVSGGAKCWGTGYDGQLGTGGTTRYYQPIDVSGLSAGVTAVTAGYYHGCAVVSGSVKCWGKNDYGQLGDGSTTNRLAPVTTSNLSAAFTVSTSARSTHTCAATSSSALKCWGLNGSGQVGNSNKVATPTATSVNP